MATASSFTALPDDVLNRVLLGVALDDHDATAAACRVFRDVIRGPRFLRLRKEYGFAERRLIIVAQRGPAAQEIHVEGKHGAVAHVTKGLRVTTVYASTTGGARLFVSTTRHLGGPPHEILAVDASARRWSRFATLPLGQRLHCLEWHGGLLYVAGGIIDGTYVDTFHAFNETTGLWEDLPRMPHVSTLAASGVIGNQLFIAGGIDGANQDLSALQIYDITARTWRLGAPLPRALYGAWGVVVGDGKLYVVSSRLSEVQCMLMYDVQSNTWTEQSLPPQESGGLMHAFAHKGSIVAVYSSGSVYQGETGSDQNNWSRIHLDVAPGAVYGALAGSVLLG